MIAIRSETYSNEPRTAKYSQSTYVIRAIGCFILFTSMEARMEDEMGRKPGYAHMVDVTDSASDKSRTAPS